MGSSKKNNNSRGRAAGHSGSSSRLGQPQMASSPSTPQGNIVTEQHGVSALPSLEGIVSQFPTQEELQRNADMLDVIIRQNENPAREDNPDPRPEVAETLVHNAVVVEEVSVIEPPIESVQQTRPPVWSRAAYNHVMIMESYPPPGDVIEHPNVVADLVSTNALSALRPFNPSDVYHSGPVIIGTTFGNVELSVYEQMQMRVIAVYYAQLPRAEPTREVFELLMYYGHLASGARRPPPDNIGAIYQRLTGESLDYLAQTVMRIAIPPAMYQPDAIEDVTDTFAHASYEQLRCTYPDACVVINFLEFVVKGFWDELLPIPELALDNDNLSLYISQLRKGRTAITFSEVLITPFIYRREEFYPDEQASEDENAPFVDSGTLQTVSTVVVGSYRDRFRQVERGESSLEASRRNRPDESLLSQGQPGENRIIRDTTGFREHVADMQSVEAILNELSTGQAQLFAEVALISEQMRSLSALPELVVNVQNEIRARSERIAAVQELILNTLNSRDLMTRQHVNQTVLSEVPSLPVRTPQMIIPAGTSAISQLKESVIAKLNQVTPQNATLVAEEVNRLIENTPLSGLASMITGNKLMIESVRTRLLERIRRL